MTGIMLQFASGFNFQDFLNNLATMGFFSYVLPFLLIFAVVYSLLVRIDIFRDNKGAAVLIAFAIGLLALQLSWVSEFFQTVFPRFGIGVALLLIALILAGAFISDKTSYKWIFFGLGVLIFIIVMLGAFSDWRFTGTNWWDQYGSVAIVITLVVAGIVGVILSSKGNGVGNHKKEGK